MAHLGMKRICVLSLTHTVLRVMCHDFGDAAKPISDLLLRGFVLTQLRPRGGVAGEARLCFGLASRAAVRGAAKCLRGQGRQSQPLLWTRLFQAKWSVRRACFQAVACVVLAGDWEGGLAFVLKGEEGL